MSVFEQITRMVPRVRMKAKPGQVVQDLPVTTGAEGSLKIPVADRSPEDLTRAFWQERGQFLSRQENWALFSDELAEADVSVLLTEGGMGISDLMAFGARADVVAAVEHALADPLRRSDDPLLNGIEALERVMEDHPDTYAVAAVIALAHIDIAWAWRGRGNAAQVPRQNMDVFEAHMERAAEVLLPYCGTRLQSPLVLAAECGLQPFLSDSCADPADGLSEAYGTLFDVSPGATRHLRDFGMLMLPRAHGSYARLESEARLHADNLRDCWGAGGYTWIMLDAICADFEALAGLDVDVFIQGMRDILHRQTDQYTANLFAAFCAVTKSADTGNDAADFNRARIHACREWVICEHLTELHPLVWARAARNFDESVCGKSLDRIAKKGQEEAHRVLRSLFLRELARGQNIVFTDHGPVTELPRRSATQKST